MKKAAFQPLFFDYRPLCFLKRKTRFRPTLFASYI
ncbi:Hypothetical protein, conserved [Brucella suis ATCC 23445]|uniref:Uncharacterized protein n=1 Tax=Brucella suis (strain ATCC 23445 / NCTC 10510) TaxID=470137 RepID=B0CGH4_BRUSI|nr:Hypothetical protein, conserved [Brucella suis ATCC 23445]